jgi:hypothetical protein
MHVFICLLFFILMPFCVYPQEEKPDRIIQRFAWSGANALRYEIIFEKETDGIYVPHLTEHTPLLHVEVSLSVGNYRFRVIPYDILDRPWEGSLWRYIEILPVPQFVFLDEFELPEPELDEVEFELVELLPDEVEEPEPVLAKGELLPLKSTLTNIGLFWMPLIPVYGEEFGIDSVFTGAGLRASIVFLIPSNIYIGPELTTFFSSDKMMIVMAGINILTMKWLPDERIAFGLRFGAVYPVISDQHEDIISNTGVSLHWRINNFILLEAGLDYLHIFSDNYSGCIRPWFGVSYQLK